MSTERKANRLIDEKSPYLRQHCYNPVDWYPWGDEAFTKAKELEYPIFLSVGYSTCHWCHVMERESFENAEIAKLLNDNFVSVKVDREERPDVDKLYMTFVQAITGGGGWPMSVFLTPELEPLTGGTYFPPNDDHGRTGFASLLRLIAQQWNENRAEIRRQGSGLAGAIRERAKQTAAAAPPPAALAWDGCYRRLAADFDDEHGGFGLAPKFPKPVDQMFLLYFHHQNRLSGGDRAARALEMVGRTLDKMADGGIHDHVGKGFHRYSVDESWHVPHFEKMLYDEAQLLELYANYYKLTGRQLDVVLDVSAYLRDSLSHPEGGFFCAEDADSLPTADSTHKREGAFCVWTKAEVEEELADRPARSNENLTLDELFCTAYNVLDSGNVPSHVDIHNELRGQNVLKRLDAAALDKFARECRMDAGQLRVCLADARGFLAERRAKRPAPHLDRKLLTSWNALAVSEERGRWSVASFGPGFGQIESGRLCAAATIATCHTASSSEPSADPAFDARTAAALRERASRTLAFIRSRLTDPTASGRLWRSVYADEADNRIVQIQTPIQAFADDYAFTIQALLDMYETDFDEDRLRWALDLQTTMDAEFWDEAGQTGYFFSRADDPTIFARVHDDQDGAEPCANSVALSNLLRLAAIFDSADYAKRAENILRGAAERLEKHPYILTRMASALYLHANAVPEIVVVGSKADETVKAMIAEIQSRFLPRKYLVFIDVDAKADSLLVARNEHFATLASCGSKPTVYFCKDSACEMPIGSVEELCQRLDQL